MYTSKECEYSYKKKWLSSFYLVSEVVLDFCFFTYPLNMLLHPTEINIQFVEVLQVGSSECFLGQLGKDIDIIGEALATVSVLAIWTRGVVDISGQ